MGARGIKQLKPKPASRWSDEKQNRPCPALFSSLPFVGGFTPAPPFWGAIIPYGRSPSVESPRRRKARKRWDLTRPCFFPRRESLSFTPLLPNIWEETSDGHLAFASALSPKRAWGLSATFRDEGKTRHRDEGGLPPPGRKRPPIMKRRRGLFPGKFGGERGWVWRGTYINPPWPARVPMFHGRWIQDSRFKQEKFSTVYRSIIWAPELSISNSGTPLQPPSIGCFLGPRPAQRSRGLPPIAVRIRCPGRHGN